jgi:hypothetical protein
MRPLSQSQSPSPSTKSSTTQHCRHRSQSPSSSLGSRRSHRRPLLSCSSLAVDGRCLLNPKLPLHGLKSWCGTHGPVVSCLHPIVILHGVTCPLALRMARRAPTNAVVPPDSVPWQNPARRRHPERCVSALNAHTLTNCATGLAFPTHTAAPTNNSDAPAATIVHLAIRPYAPGGEEDGLKKKGRRRRVDGVSEEGVVEDRGCCCVIC